MAYNALCLSGGQFHYFGLNDISTDFSQSNGCDTVIGIGDEMGAERCMELTAFWMTEEWLYLQHIWKIISTVILSIYVNHDKFVPGFFYLLFNGIKTLMNLSFQDNITLDKIS